MNTWTTTLTAAEAIAIGACDGRCLVASKDVCDCVCGGAYHGVLAGSAIGEITHTARPAKGSPERKPTSSGRTVRRHKAPDYEAMAREMVAAEFMIDSRADGRTYRQIADDLGVSRSTVSKRLNEFVGGAE